MERYLLRQREARAAKHAWRRGFVVGVIVGIVLVLAIYWISLDP